MDDIEEKFKIVIPAELHKAKNGDWKVRGLASTESFDLQGETLVQKGMDLSPIDKKKGVLNYDHGKGPENTIGLLDGYTKTEKGLFIEGRLFKNHTKAKAVYEIMSSLSEDDIGRMGMSVEGTILERDKKNPKIVKRCRINAVALTMNPVNTETYVDLMKSLNNSEVEFNADGTSLEEESSVEVATFSASQVMEILQRALGVGAGYTKPPETLTGGDSLATSNMKETKEDKKKKVADRKTELNVRKSLKKMDCELYKANLTLILNKLQELYPKNSRSDIWNAVKERLYTRFPDLEDEN